MLDDFNNIMDEFMVKMINEVPDEPKIRTYYNAFKISRSFAKDLPLKIFMGGCWDYREFIKNRDSEFFLNKKTFVDKCVNASSFSNDVGLRDRWMSTNEETKDAIWEYVQTLFVLAEMHVGSNEELMGTINNIYNNMSLNEISRFKDPTVNSFTSSFASKIK
jgi:hypothetical protein